MEQICTVRMSEKIETCHRSEWTMPEATRMLRSGNCFYRVVTIKIVRLDGNVYCWLFKTMQDYLRGLFCFLPGNSTGDTPGRGIIYHTKSIYMKGEKE